VGYPLQLVSPQAGDKTHSQFESALAEVEGARPMPVRIRRQNTVNGESADLDLVEIFNSRGVCLARAEISDDIYPQALSLETEAWLTLDENGRELLGNPNVLTRDIGTSELAQGSTAHTARVDIRKLDL